MKKEYILVGILFCFIIFFSIFIVFNYKKDIKTEKKMENKSEEKNVKKEEIIDESEKEKNENYKVELIKEETNEEVKKEINKEEILIEEKEINEEPQVLKYIVNFKYNGGVENIKAKEVTSLESYGELPITTKEGYTFLGWYTKDNKKIESTDIVQITKNQTLYAHYSINNYVIKYDYNYLENNLYNDLENKDYWNQEYEILTNNEMFLNENVYKFNFSDNILKYSENKKLEKDKIYTYSVYLKTDVEKQVEIGIGNNLTKVTINGDFTKFTKTFKILEDCSDEFIIKFDEEISNDKIIEIYGLSISEGNENIYEITKNYNEKISDIELKKREGYTFDGWYKDPLFKDKIDKEKVTNDATYYAKWNINLYTLKIDPNEGIYENSDQITEFVNGYGTKLELKVPTSNYKITYDLNSTDALIDKTEDNILRNFKNWTDKDGNVLSDNIHIFNKDTYIKANYEDNVSTTVIPITKENYVCVWNTKKDGSGTNYEQNIELNKDITLYAICNKIIKFERPINNGTITSEYGNRIHPISGVNKFHTGIDMVSNDKNIYPVLPGTVSKTGNNSSMGNYILIHHEYNGQKYTSAYYHLETKNVRKGQKVTQDTVIGIMGQTGAATGVHLHLTMYKGYLDIEETTMINPKEVIDLPNTWENKIY